MFANEKRQLGWLRTCAAAATDLLFPPACVACGTEIECPPGRVELCATCDASLAGERRDACPRCAQFCSEADLAQGDCPNCRDRRLGFREARALGPYEGFLRSAVLKCKPAAGESLAWALGQRLAEQVELQPFASPPTLVAPVPMHWAKRLWRGANGVEVMAGAVARRLGLRLARGLLVCRRFLRRQATLTPAERRKNVRDAFRASRRWKINGQTVLLVDDVMTTGATAEEAAKALLAAGAAAVCVATIARSSQGGSLS